MTSSHSSGLLKRIVWSMVSQAAASPIMVWWKIQVSNNGKVVRNQTRSRYMERTLHAAEHSMRKCRWMWVGKSQLVDGGRETPMPYVVHCVTPIIYACIPIFVPRSLTFGLWPEYLFRGWSFSDKTNLLQWTEKLSCWLLSIMAECRKYLLYLLDTGYSSDAFRFGNGLWHHWSEFSLWLACWLSKR